jgi:hypothetical protein
MGTAVLIHRLPGGFTHRLRSRHGLAAGLAPMLPLWLCPLPL